MFGDAMGRSFVQYQMLKAEIERPNDAEIHPVWYLLDHRWLFKYTPRQAWAFTQEVREAYKVQTGDYPPQSTGALGMPIDSYRGYEDYRLIAEVYRERMEEICARFPAKDPE